jgi:hypothetical protein
MTNTANTTSPAPIFILSTRQYRNATAYAIDHVDGFEASVYRAALNAGTSLRDLALDDWHNHWAQGDEAHATATAAFEAADEAGAYVIEFTIEDAEAAIRDLIGDAE